MRNIILTGFVLMGMMPNLLSQTSSIEIRKGSVLTYAIKEGSRSYMYTVTIKAWDDNSHILSWKTNEKPTIRSGTIELGKYFILDSEELVVGIGKSGDIVLDDSKSQLIAPAFLASLFDEEEDEVEIKINENGKLIPLTIEYDNISTELTKEITYKGKIIKTDVYNLPANKKNPEIGFIQESNNYKYVLAYYKSNELTMDLVSIKTPEKEPIPPTKPTTGTPVVKTASTKMDPKKLTVVKSKYPLLATLETYDVTNGGKDPKPFSETYDFRQASGAGNPPSAVDCFTADLQILYTQRKNYGLADMTETLEKNKLSAGAAEKLLGVYGQKEARSIPGYKPWTHWNFVKSLSAQQKTKLAVQLEAYIKQYGFTE